MTPNSLLLLFLVLLSGNLSRSSATHLRDRFIVHRSSNSNISSEPQEYFDPTVPSDLLPAGDPSCSHSLLSHAFGYTYGSPPISTHFSPPNSSCHWSRAILDLSVSCAGDQYDRIAAVWIDGAEVLRTSTAEPTPAGVFWRVRKDITRYSPLLRQPQGAVVSVILENIVDDVFTGVYHLNLSLHFYEDDDLGLFLPSSSPHSLKYLLYEDEADVIIPVSDEDNSTGFWFRIEDETDVRSKSVRFPTNAYRAALEVYVSFHGDDEFWYWNPPDSYIHKNNLTTKRGNGAFRSVVVTIDGQFVGSIVPFPVIFTGGINPLFWSPVVAIGAFDLPSYHLDITPFLGLLLDEEPHEIGFRVTDGISFWLVDANLHLWLDSDSDEVAAKLIRYQAPPLTISRDAEFQKLNGVFKIEAERKIHFSGWVISSLGNLTTDVDQKIKYKSLLLFRNNGNFKEILMKGKMKNEVKIRDKHGIVLSREVYKSKYPLLIMSSTSPGRNGTYVMKTNLTHALNEKKTSTVLERVALTSSIIDRQSGFGWMRVQDHSVLDGSARTHQIYRYQDNGRCHLRKMSARDGELLYDNSSNSCAYAW